MSHLQRYDGFLYQWYDTANGHVLTNPGQGNSAESTPTFGNCFFVSNVGNGWYASGTDRGPRSHARAAALRGRPDRADELRYLL